MMKKFLIAYFSKTNNTKKVASQLSEILDAPTHRIEEKDEYKPSDINWTVEDCRANQENSDPNCRPAIKDAPLDSDFDILVLGFPLWWGEAPKVVRTFLEKNEKVLQNKKIVLFCTSEMTPIYQTQMNLKYGYPMLNFLNGVRTTGFSNAQLKAWTKTFNR